MKSYRALKSFENPLVGSASKGDIFLFGADSIKPLVKAGLCEEAKKEVKTEKETKKPKQKAKD